MPPLKCMPLDSVESVEPMLIFAAVMVCLGSNPPPIGVIHIEEYAERCWRYG